MGKDKINTNNSIRKEKVMSKKEEKNMDELVDQITKEIKDIDRWEKEETKIIRREMITAILIFTVCALIGFTQRGLLVFSVIGPLLAVLVLRHDKLKIFRDILLGLGVVCVVIYLFISVYIL